MEMKILQDYVLGKTPLEVITAIAFSSTLTGMISEDTEIDNPIIHLSGDSTTGKTTALMLAASFYGSPNPKGKGIFSTWNGTKNAMIAKLRDNHGIIAIFDESSMSKITDFTDVIYMLAAGSDKERLNSDSEIKDKKEWTTTILSSGEHNLTSKSKENTGIKMRILEFMNIEWTESAEHSDEIKSRVLENYGHLGAEFGKVLVDLGKDKVIKIFRDWSDKCYARMNKDDKFSRRLSKPIAIIMASAQIARDKLGIELNIDNILEFLIKTQNNNKLTNDIGMRAYEYFLEMYSVHSGKFINSELLINNGLAPKQIWGKYVCNKDKPNTVLILPNISKEIMHEGGFEDINVILSKWRDKKLLDCDNNRYTRKRNIDGINKRVNVVRIVDNFFSKEENEEAKKSKRLKKSLIKSKK